MSKYVSELTWTMILFKFLDPDCDSGSDDEDDNPLPSDGKWVLLE